MTSSTFTIQHRRFSSLMQLQTEPLEGSIVQKMDSVFYFCPWPSVLVGRTAIQTRSISTSVSCQTHWLLSGPCPLQRLCPLGLPGPCLLPPSLSPSRPAVESRCVCGGAGPAGSWQHRRPPLHLWLPRKPQTAVESPACTPRSLHGGGGQSRKENWRIEMHITLDREMEGQMHLSQCVLYMAE